MKRKLARTTIKLPGDVYEKLKAVRKRTGIPITNLVRLAVFNYTLRKHPGPGRPRRTKRGSR